MDLSDYAKKLQKQLSNEIEKLFAQIPNGHYLCVHDDVETNYCDPDGLVNVTQQVHILANPWRCKDPVKKTQYGPKES